MFPNRNTKRIGKLIYALTLILLSAIFSVIAVFGLFIYAREIYLSVGSNDKSLLYWYLPFLFAGIIFAVLAVGTGLLAYKKMKNRS